MIASRSAAVVLAVATLLNVACAIDCKDGVNIKEGASCPGSTFDNVNFFEIDARNVDFSDSSFSSVMFGQDSTIDTASFAGSSFSGDSTFSGTSANNVDFSNLKIDGSVTFQPGSGNTALEGSSFQGVTDGKIVLDNVFAPKTNFRGVTSDLEINQGDFTGADFTGADISSFKANQGSYAGVTFTDANIDDLELSGGSWAGDSVDFSGANIGSITIDGTEMTGASFTGASIQSGQISGTLAGANFDGADLSNIDFSNAKLEGASFIGANLEGVTFTEAILKDSAFTDATFKDISITNTDLSGADFFDVIDNGNVVVSGVGDDCCLACATDVIDCGNQCKKSCDPQITRPPVKTQSPQSTTKPAASIAPETSRTPGTTLAPVPDSSASLAPGETASSTPTGDDNTTTTSDAPEDDDVCFPGSATVELESGIVKSMRDLAIGDRVRVSETEFSSIYFFSHKVASGLRRMVRISSDDSSVIEMTPSHYLYVNDALTAAKNAMVGDVIQTVQSGTAKIEKIEMVLAEGLFNPHTRHGDIVVDGVVTSTYTTSVPPTVASLLLLPERLANMFGASVYGGLLEGAAPEFLKAVRSSVTAKN